jgi:pimeloyl-ACP methyl ester carboxylesterase
MRLDRLRACVGAIVLLASTAVLAQIAPPRTWPELKQAVQERADGQRYPLTGFDKKEVAEILERIGSLDRDEWARAWMVTGQKHFDAARRAETTNPGHAREAYLAAWRYFGFGAWPTQNSPEKKRAHALAVEAFRAYARLADPPIEVLRIPFEGKEIVAYLQRPAGVARPPVVLSVGGLDSYKEYVVEQYGPGYLAAGLAYVALDMPGTGEAPIRIDVGAERMFSRVIDGLQSRTDIDPARMGFQGVSWGGHWAARIAYVEPQRLRAVVNWAGPVHGYFQREWQIKALGTREYLFDLFPARAGVYGVESLDDFLAYGPRMSLKDGGFLGRSSAPLLLVNGERDSQVPIDDLYILLKSGAPKEAWVNPEGGHIGRGKGWPDSRIFVEVIVPWFQAKLK